MVVINDSYTHSLSCVVYTVESIPGPRENSREYKDLLENFNSQLTNCCYCKEYCTVASCECLQVSSKNVKQKDDKIISVLNSDDVQPIIECNVYCSCLLTCKNRVVQRGPIEGLTVHTCKPKSKGLGLFTTNYIVKGCFICEYAGELLTESQALERQKINKMESRMNFIFCLNEYSNGVKLQTFVDPSFIGNIGRYINHSCQPNSHIVPVRCNTPIPKLAIFASEDILPNKEITLNYGSHTLNSIFNLNKKHCMCGSDECIGFLPYDTY